MRHGRGWRVLVVGLSVLIAVPALAGGGQRIPFHGRLEQHGQAVDGAHDLGFKAFAACSATPDGDPDSSADGSLWRERHDGVPVQAGHFAVVLGGSAVLPQSLWMNAAPCLAIYLRPAGSGAFILLQGLQPLLQVPFAARTDNATGLNFPSSRAPDATYSSSYIGTAGNFLSFGHASTSEDLISYRGNTFYLRDAPGGGDTADPHLDVGGNLRVRGNVQLDGELVASGLSGMPPVGAIIDWWRPAGSTATPPANWVICDGSLITVSGSPFEGQNAPDLRDRFVRGTGTLTAIGGTGGAATHAHQQTGGDMRTGLSGSYAPAEQGFTTTSSSNLPPYTTLLKIMRVK
jgi:hypothetical protein